MTFEKKDANNLIAGLILIMGIVIIYRQVSHHAFINYDDGQYVYANPHIENGLTWKSVKWAFRSVYAANWHPLTWVSHMTDISLFGMNAGLHHLTNVFFHILNSLLIFYIFNRTTRLFRHSFFLSALFAFHPMHVESVAWLSERKDVLSTFFCFLTILSYVRYVEMPDLRRYLSVIVFFSLGLMSKPMLVTLPFVLVLIDFWPLRRFDIFSNVLKIKSLVIEKIPLIILAGVSCVITLIAQKSGGAVVPADQSPLMVRVPNAIVSYVTYLYKMIWPFDLAIPYPYPSHIPYSNTFCAMIFIIAATILCVRLVRSHPYLIMGWLWYLGTLFPVIGLIQIGNQAIADRYTYIPYIGIYIAVLWGGADLTAKLRNRSVFYCSAGTIAVLFLIFLSWLQTGYWKNSITLFTHTVKVTEKNFTAHNNLANALLDNGMTADAIDHYKKVIHWDPKDADAYNNLGVAYAKQNQMDQAIRQYKKALDLSPYFVKAMNNLGVALAYKGKIKEAMLCFQSALKIEPEYLDARNNLDRMKALSDSDSRGERY